MEKYHGNTVEYWKQNTEKYYLTTPISVLKYITVLEEQAERLRQPHVSGRSEQSNCVHCHEHILTVKTLKYKCKHCGDEKWVQLD